MKFARAPFSVVALLGFVADGCIAEDLGDIATVSRFDQEIVNGTFDPNARQVVELLLPGGPCTGTLITSQTVLTAAHCKDPNSNMVTIQGEELRWNPVLSTWDWGVYQVPGTWVINLNSDVALVNLTCPVGTNGISLSQIGTYVREGMPIFLFGFGESAYGAQDWGWGFRRRAYNTIDSFDAMKFYFNGTTGPEGATCRGDSGGPAYRTWTDCIVGITWGQTSGPLCDQSGGSFYDSRVDPWITWIQQHAIGTVQTCTPP
jgi:hypothetical protein